MSNTRVSTQIDVTASPERAFDAIVDQWWSETAVEFTVTASHGTTTVHFTHHGLIATLECFGACLRGWDHFIQTSLRPLIETGSGNPTREAA